MDEQISNSDGMLAIHESIKDLNLAAIVANAPTAYYGVESDVEREQIKGIFISRALELGNDAVSIIKKTFSTLDRAKRLEEAQEKKQIALQVASAMPVWLELDRNGQPIDSLNNYITIMRTDSKYANYKYNLLKAQPEIHIVDHVKKTITIKPWEDADEAESQRYIEEQYHIFNDTKHKKALTLLFREREYNPVLDIVDNLPAWDGVPRISEFLIKYMGCDDTPYTREVSRLIFAGGINRLYNPGCKFDDVPVLIGTKQGEGKTTIIKWLAIHDDYYSECTSFDGGASIEQLEGAWICEISEMLALKRASEQEAVKAYITRQVDKYRKPYAKNPTNLPRRCIFVGSTNVQNFLSDRTGNRRWYPVTVNMSGYDLYDMEQECRDYILLCWAEARDKFKAGKMPNFADKNLVEDYREAQANSMVEDWRDSAIIDYLSKMDVGDKVCVRQIAREALPMEGDTIRDPSRADAHVISLIMSKQANWQRSNKPIHISAEYGTQRGWVKIAPDEPVTDTGIEKEVEIPF